MLYINFLNLELINNLLDHTVSFDFIRLIIFYLGPKPPPLIEPGAPKPLPPVNKLKS